jgi:hypothetical protein
LLRLFVRLLYDRLPFSMTQYKSKWLIKCIRINAATVENALPVFDLRIKTVSGKCAISVAQTCVLMY